MSDSELYGELMREYAERSPFIGQMESPTFTVKGGNPACGDEVELQVLLDGETVKTTRFQAHGCLVNRAASGLLAELVNAKTVSEVLRLSLAHLEGALGAEFRSRAKCALLPLFLLQEGLKRYHAARPEGESGVVFRISAPRSLGT